MYRLVFPVVLLLLGPACSKYYYVELLEGDWVGTATGDDGVAKPMIASFTYNEDQDRAFSGSVDIDGWIYSVEAANSDKKAAEIDLYNALGVRDALLSKVTVEETTMKGSYSENICLATGGAGAGCEFGGSFSLELQ